MEATINKMLEINADNAEVKVSLSTEERTTLTVDGSNNCVIYDKEVHDFYDIDKKEKDGKTIYKFTPKYFKAFYKIAWFIVVCCAVLCLLCGTLGHNTIGDTSKVYDYIAYIFGTFAIIFTVRILYSKKVGRL